MGFEICPKQRRSSQSMKNILKKTPIYSNSFMNIREATFPAIVSFDENGNPSVDAWFPAEIQQGMKNGTISFSKEEFAMTCRKLAEKAREQIKLKSNPTRVWHR